MSEAQKQMLMDITSIAYCLDEESQRKIEKVAVSLLNVKLLEVMPDLELSELDELDSTEKLMLINEFSLSPEERQKEKEEAIPLEEALKKVGLTINDIQD